MRLVSNTGSPGCFVCEKHSSGEHAQGGVVFEDDLIYIGHVHALKAAKAYRSWLVIEPKRHVAEIGDLDDAEASALGLACSRTARVLRTTVGAEHVYLFVFGDEVPHLHVHVVPRYSRTPRQFWGPRLNAWPDAPRVDADEMRALVSRLRDQIRT
jgi:histidine triad (HIT) family protein